MPKTAYELEREANIAKNRALLEELDLKGAIAQLGIPSKTKAQAKPKTNAKPVQPANKRKRSDAVAEPTRQSTRLRRGAVDPNESPGKKRKREQEEEERRKKEEDERLEAEERAREARRPRHDDLDLNTLLEDSEPGELADLKTTLKQLCGTAQPRRVADQDAFVFDDDEKEEIELAQLRKKFQKLKVVSRAKVTQDRVYSAAYHPDVTKDIIVFGDKHGQLGIWDARAAPDDVADEDGDVSVAEDAEGGKYWRLQAHWPATSKSSISTVKFNPIDSHSVFTSAYDCTIRNLSLTSGVSQEIHSTEDVLISSIDLAPSGREMWVADALGGLTHLDLREHKSRARWYGLSDQKIGCVSINPVNPHYLLTASNSRALRLWDARKLQSISGTAESALLTPPPSSPISSRALRSHTHEPDPEEYGIEDVEQFVQSKKGRGCLRGEWAHGKSVSSAYWDPRGRSIVSTSYDDTLRLWNINPAILDNNTTLPSSRPFAQLKHNCQTGKWLTILRAQWSPNPDAYPHFTIGNMDHSLDIFSCKGDLIARLTDRQRITAVQAVTCSHPNVIERAASGNASGRCVLWSLPESS